MEPATKNSPRTNETTAAPPPATQPATITPEEQAAILASPTVPNVQTPTEEVDVEDKAPSRAAHIEMAQDDSGEWHWCLWSANGRALCASMQTFPRRHDCQKNVETTLGLMRDKRLKIVATVGQ